MVATASATCVMRALPCRSRAPPSSATIAPRLHSVAATTSARMVRAPSSSRRARRPICDGVAATIIQPASAR